MPLDDVTVVEPGKFLVAKLPCIGCPTRRTSGDKDHKSILRPDEENTIVRTCRRHVEGAATLSLPSHSFSMSLYPRTDRPCFYRMYPSIRP